MGHKRDKFSLMTRWQQMPRGEALAKILSCVLMLSCVLTWPRPLLTLKSHSSPKFQHFSQTSCSVTRRRMHTSKPAYRRYLHNVHTVELRGCCCFFFWLWWMRRAVQRSGTNAVNTFPARRGRLNQRDCPRLSWLTESFGPKFWQKQALCEENMVEMCISRRLLQYLFAAVYK